MPKLPLPFHFRSDARLFRREPRAARSTNMASAAARIRSCTRAWKGCTAKTPSASNVMAAIVRQQLMREPDEYCEDRFILLLLAASLRLVGF